MSAPFTKVRTARLTHPCECGKAIRPGDRYIVHKAPPGSDDVDNETWWTVNECAECATRYGRGDLVQEVQP